MSARLTYKTSKGTELPLLNLRGKEYLEVKFRIVWLREEHPEWAIETELLNVSENSAFARAVIKDETGRILATSHKYEDRKGFPDFIEKAETGAIGRACALLGYGTQFCADELDEGSRIVDAPVTPPSEYSSGPTPDEVEAALNGMERQLQRPTPKSGPQGLPKDPGDYMVTFGKKYKGLKIRDIPRNDIEAYIEWLEENASKKGLPLSEEARFLKVNYERFIRHRMNPKDNGEAAS